MKPSQKKTYEWYKAHTNRFDNIESMCALDSGEFEIVTDTEYFILGKNGGLTQNLKIKS
jgi:hypothetical protein|tara:strand:+ start:756 stop:932 length:177 start_codon:yes stop_codon:yes gene_type:complete